MLAGSRTLVLCALLAPPAAGAFQERSGPTLHGWVLEHLWQDAVPGADVLLLDVDLNELDRTRTDEEGRFRLTLPPVGAYYLQARFGGSSSAVVGPVTVAEGTEPEGLVLTIASPLAAAAIRCLSEEVAETSGAVVGVVYDVGSEIPLPGARVLVQWEGVGPDRSGGSETETDAWGRFSVCGLPTDVTVTVWAQALGRTSAPITHEVAEAGSIARVDVALGMAAAEPEARVTATARAEAAASPAVLAGVLVDATTEHSVSAAIVRIIPSSDARETDPQGRFWFGSVPEGRHTLEVEHLAYGVQRVEVEVVGGTDVEVTLRMTPRALQLAEIEVTIDRRDRRDGFPPIGFQRPMRTLSGGRLAFLDQRGASMMAAIREISAGVRIRDESASGRYACIESTRRVMPIDELARGQAPCQMVTVVLDGVPVMDPAGTLGDLRLSDLESIEYVSPLDGAVRYGMDASARGALVLWTRGRGPHRSPDRDGGR